MLSGFHQVPLVEEHRYITTFISPYRRFRFKRQNMGMKNAGDVFHKAKN